MEKLYVQYGCGLCAPAEWLNFDASPTLRIQKTPLVGKIFPANAVFPENVRYGDIVKGLPIPNGSSDGVYCSHTLEHLSLEDFRTAIKNTYSMLKENGIFRCIVPDLEYAARKYLAGLDQGNAAASLEFMGEGTLLGLEKRPRGIKSSISSFLGNANHLWMWDRLSLQKELRDAGFREVRLCHFNDSGDPMFAYVEDHNRFVHAVAIHCIK